MNIWEDFVKLMFHYEEVPSLGTYFLLMTWPLVHKAGQKNGWGWVAAYYGVALALLYAEFWLEGVLFDRVGGPVWVWFGPLAIAGIHCIIYCVICRHTDFSVRKAVPSEQRQG